MPDFFFSRTFHEAGGRGQEQDLFGKLEKPEAPACAANEKLRSKSWAFLFGGGSGSGSGGRGGFREWERGKAGGGATSGTGARQGRAGPLPGRGHFREWELGKVEGGAASRSGGGRRGQGWSSWVGL